MKGTGRGLLNFELVKKGSVKCLLCGLYRPGVVGLDERSTDTLASSGAAFW